MDRCIFGFFELHIVVNVGTTAATKRLNSKPASNIPECLGTTTKHAPGCHKANLFFLPSPCELRGNAVWPEGGQSSSFFSQFSLIVGANRDEGVNIPPPDPTGWERLFC